MEEKAPRPPSAKYLSKTPSWVSLGFILGALFVWALPARRAEVSADVPAKALPDTGTVRQAAAPKPSITEIEAVFAGWGDQAVWDQDVTEVALWDIEGRAFSRYYEVLRARDNYYFRSIDHLTRPVLTHGVKKEGPLLYTETEEMRREWLREKANEDWKAILSPQSAPVPAKLPTDTTAP